MKTGSKVAVCYDRKYGRRVPGVVTKTRNGHHIKVRFVPYCSESEQEIEAWFSLKRYPIKFGGPRKSYEAWVRHPDEVMIMRGLFGCPGDFYTLYKWAD